MASVYVYIMETMADWETGFVLPELHSRRFFRADAPAIEVKTASIDGSPVTTMGGLKILPDMTVSDIVPAQGDMLILPGSDMWSDPTHLPVIEKAKAFLDNEAAVAAICGATVALAAAGILNDRPHTSNGPGFLEMMCPGYSGSSRYVDQPAYTDGDLITAAATGSLLFAREILEYLNVFSAESLAAWYDYFNTGSMPAFFRLMQSLQP